MTKTSWFAICAVLAALPCVLAQDEAPKKSPEVAAAAYISAMSAFNKGEYAKAAEQFELMFQTAPEEIRVEGPHFTLAAAYFNIPDYPKAREAFEKYLAKFPNAQRTNDGRLGLALALIKSDEMEKAVAELGKLELVPAYREQALLYQAQAWLAANQTEKAIAPLESLTGKPPKITTRGQADGGLLLLGSLVDLKRWDEAVVLLAAIQSQAALVDNPIRLNLTLLAFGDHFLEESQPQEALKYYRQVKSREAVTKEQEARIAGFKSRATAVEAAARNPAFAASAEREKTSLKETEVTVAAALEAFGKIPDFDEALWFRIGRAYLDAGRPWEAMLVLRHALEKYPKSGLREPTMAMMIFGMPEIVPAAETQGWCKSYLEEFPQGALADAVGYLSGAVAMQKGDYASAETFFGKMLEQQPQSTRRQEMIYMLGNALFLQGKLPEAREKYEVYAREFPDGEFVEEVLCKRALTFIYGGDFEQAIAGFNQLLEKYPSGLYAPEAKYRLAVAAYAAKEYEKTIADCEEWLKTYPADPMLAENYALMGDAYVAIDRIAEAAAAYGKSVEAAKTDEVTQYSLLEAQKMYQKTGQWDKVGDLFSAFITNHPDSPLVVTALYWVGRAKDKLGQPAEALTFTADNIRKYLNDQRRDAVEQLLQLYAQLAARKKKTDPAATPPPNPRDTTQIEKEIAAALSGTPGEGALAKARILYAQAEAAKARRNPERIAALQKKIAGDFPPEDLSAPLLALAGDNLLQEGQPEKAQKFYEMLRDDFPKSPHADAADVGLGELALAAGNTAGAEKLFRAAMGKSGMKMPDAFVGLSRALLAQKQYPEAEKLLQQVAATKQWRGERTPASLYFLGECEYEQGRYAEANAYYQRVFVSWRKYPAWVARAYLKSAECLAKLGKDAEAQKTLQEMVKQEGLEKLPEMQTARQKLEASGG